MTAAAAARTADRLGFGDRFTEGRTARQWLEHLYDRWRTDDAPTFADFLTMLHD